MPSRIPKLWQFACLILLAALPAAAQLRPEASQPAEKKPAAKPTRIVVETSPGAQVYLDDEFKGQASAEGRLVIGSPKPGEHTVRVSLAGKKDREEKLTVVAGREATVRAALADLAGSIRVHTTPGAAVFLDEVSKGTASPSGQLVIPEVAAGGHDLRVAARGKKDYRQNLPVAAGEESRVEAALADVPPPAPTAGTVRENPKDGLKYVWIPAGTFQMGCSPGDSECSHKEKPAHQVTISKGFWMGQTPVTVAGYRRFASSTGRQMPSDPPPFNHDWANQNMPVVNVTWNESLAYCQWSGGRLPTEAEWEYAARGGSTDARYGSLDDVAWYDKNSGGATHNVAEKRANGFGLYDTLGNVLEWVNDWYDANYYENSPSQDPSGPSSGQYRVLRGGSWNSTRRGVRVSGRSYFDVLDVGLTFNGFRCVGEANIP